MSADRVKPDNMYTNLRDLPPSALKGLYTKDGGANIGRSDNSGAQFTPSPTKSTRSSLGLLPPGALENISMVDSVDGSINFLKMTPEDRDGNQENIPPQFFKPRFEIESGILDEDGETDLENFLDDKDILQLDAMYTPTTSSGSESEPLSGIGKYSRTNPAGLLRDDSKTMQNASDARLIRLAENLVGKSGNILGGSSSEDLAVPLDRTYNSPVDKDGFVRPLPPGGLVTPRAAARPKPCIDTTAQGIPASLFLANTSHNASKLDLENTPSLPPRAPAGWASFLDKSSAFPASNQQSFNCSGFPWEQLVHKDAANTSATENLSPAQHQQPGGQEVEKQQSIEGVPGSYSQEAGGPSLEANGSTLETSCMGPLDPSFYSGKISARSTCLGPSGEIEDRTFDDNFSDFSKPGSFRSSYSSNYTAQDESIVHSGFPPIMSVSGQPFSASIQPKNPFDSPSTSRQSCASAAGFFDNNPFQNGSKSSALYNPFDNNESKASALNNPFDNNESKASALNNPFDNNESKSSVVYNPFDVDKHNLTSQPVDEEFQELDASYNMQNFLEAEEAECLQNHKFIQEEDMDKDSGGDSSVLSGVSDKSIVLRNNGLWAGNTSQVNLDKLREETRLSRDEYFRLKSSRLGCLEGSMLEDDRPDFGFLHKIRSPEHIPSPLIDESYSTDSSTRNTYNVVTPTFQTPELEGDGGQDEEGELENSPPPQFFNVSQNSNPSREGQRKPSLTGGSVPSSAESSYLNSGDSTKTLTSINNTGDMKVLDLAERLEALTDNLSGSDGLNISYPDVVEASLNQGRDLEKSLASLVDGEINLSTISRALSEANVSLDPQQFVNLIKNTFKAQSAVKTSTKPDDDKTPVPSPSSTPAAFTTASQTQTKIPTRVQPITTTPKTSADSDSAFKARRKLSSDTTDTKQKSPTVTITDSIRKNIKPLQTSLKQSSSVSAPVTPRDTPVPPLLKSTSVPYSIESTGRRKHPSGSKHSSPKKSPKKVVIKTDHPQGLEHLLETEHTPSMCVTHRKHLQTSTPYHPNLNLSSVIMDNLVTGDKSISPFVNPDLSINAANLDVSVVSPDLYYSIQKSSQAMPPVRHLTPSSGFTEVQVGSDSHHHNSVLHMDESVNIDQVFSSHCWQIIKVPIQHTAMQEFKAVLKISNIWIGSVEIPSEFWNQILSMSSTELVITVKPSADSIELQVFARREGAFAINIGLISPGGHISSGIVRFQMEEPVLRLLTRNGHTIDFGTAVYKSTSSIPVMLVNGGSSNLSLTVEVVSDSNLFSFNEDKTEKICQFIIPGCTKTAGQGEGIMKELKIWALTGTIGRKHTEPCVYTGQLEIKLGTRESKVVLGRVQILLRVCFSSLVMKPANYLEFTCADGKKICQKLEVSCEGSLPVDVEAQVDNNGKGIFILEKKFKLNPGVPKSLNIEFVSRPGCTGKGTQDLVLKMSPGGITYKVELRTKVLSKQQENLFTTNNSPGLKLGVLAAEESLDRFPVDADRNLMNWFAVEVGETECQQINLRNSFNFPVTLNVMIRDCDEFCLKESEGEGSTDLKTKISFNPNETKTLGLVYRPKSAKPVKGKLVLKPVNIKIGGKIFKASITLKGYPGSSVMKIMDLKSTDDAKFYLDIEQEPPVSRQFRIKNEGSATGFLKIVCLETMGHKEDAQVTIAPSEFLLQPGASSTVILTFGSDYSASEANLAIFCGTEVVRSVYTRARQLPGCVRLSGSTALLGIDFTKPFGEEDEQKSIAFTGDITPEDANHFYNKSQKLNVKVSLLEKQADFQALGVEETLSETRLETTAMAAAMNHTKTKWDHLTASPPTPDITPARILQILPQTVTLSPGAEAIVKIMNKSSGTLHWDLNYSPDYLDCSPPAGQLARGGQAIILVSAKQDAVVSSQGWRGQVEVFSEQTVDYINVVVKPKSGLVKYLVEASPTSLDFGCVALSSTGQDRKVLSLTNQSQALVQWKAFVNDGDMFVLSEYSGLLNPGQTINLAVAFQPHKSGNVNAVVDIISHVVKGGVRDNQDGPYLPVTVQLKGQAVQAFHTATPNQKVKAEILTNRAGASNQKLKEPSAVTVPDSGDQSRQPQPVGVVRQGQGAESRQQRSNGKCVLSLENDNIGFGNVVVGRNQISKVTVKNRTGSAEMISLSLEPGSTFTIIYDKVEVKSQSFSRIPVYFRPSCAGRFGAHLTIRSDSGWSKVATLHGTAVDIQGDVTATL